jgi:hypothetical protein
MEHKNGHNLTKLYKPLWLSNYNKELILIASFLRLIEIPTDI